MDNNQKSIGEQMIEKLNGLSNLFTLLENEQKEKLTTDEQKEEYEKLKKDHKVNDAIQEMKSKMDELKNKICSL